MKKDTATPEDWGDAEALRRRFKLVGNEVGMPVRRFRSMEEMEDPRLAAAIARVWSFAERLCPLRFPPGVHKHHSVDEAQQLRDQWKKRTSRSRLRIPRLVPPGEARRR